VDDFNIGPVYHGGTWDGTKLVRVNGRGALGVGAYFTPISSVADTYAKESGGQLTKAFLRIHNPLKLESGDGSHPAIQALTKLGMPEAKAIKLVERVEEQHGYMGGEIKKLAITQGYDGIFQYFNGTLREIVVWSPHQVKVVSNDS
jgi:hypothetical protein